MNRTTELSFWFEKQGLHDPISFVFGNGLGSSHISGHLSIRYLGYGIGLTTASTLLWEMGLFGFGLFLAILILAWGCAVRLQRESTIPEVKADALAMQSALMLFAFYLFYRPGMLEIIGLQILFTAMLGYLAWLYRWHSCK